MSFLLHPPAWLRTVYVAVLIGLGAVLLLFPAWLPNKPRLPVEDSAVEILQSALLGFSAALFFATVPHAGSFGPIYRAWGIACLGVLVAEIGRAIDHLIDPLRHEYIMVALLAIILITLARHRKVFLRFVGLASRHPASGFMAAAVILVYAFARVFSSEAFWSATLDGQHHPDTPKVCAAYLELLACYFVLLGAIGFCIPLTRRAQRPVPNP